MIRLPRYSTYMCVAIIYNTEPFVYVYIISVCGSYSGFHLVGGGGGASSKNIEIIIIGVKIYYMGVDETLVLNCSLVPRPSFLPGPLESFFPHIIIKGTGG